MDVLALARDERAEMAEFLASLRLEQWHPSLCAGWRIRDVAAHVLSYEEHGAADLIKRLVKARFRPGQRLVVPPRGSGAASDSWIPPKRS